MQRAISLIDRKTKELVKEPFFRWLADDSIDPRARLNFSPAMLYYLMGFKDVLDAAHTDNPQNDLERMINAYCVEDSGHWRWYLKDLETLGYSLESWGESIQGHCREIWSPETAINRSVIFSLVGYARASSDPLLRLVEIQILESTGLLFLEHTRKAAQAMDLDDTLMYFGRHHYEEELHHTVQPDKLCQYVLSDESYEKAMAMIADLWPMFEQMFQCWFEHRDKYTYASATVS